MGVGVCFVSEDITKCTRCPRLRSYCEDIAKEKRRAYLHETYWGRPVPDFGDASSGGLWIVGLAPSAHGANRTGRLITGDQSGVWLYKALFKAGLSNQETSQNRDDGLQLRKTLITNLIHCAPPNNKPTPDEIANCRSYFLDSFHLKNPNIIVALGQMAWKECLKLSPFEKLENTQKKFFHGAEVFTNEVHLLATYHPSQQNTFTGKLKWPEFLAVFQRAAALIDNP